MSRHKRGWRVFPANADDWLPRWRDQHGRDPIAAMLGPGLPTSAARPAACPHPRLEVLGGRYLLQRAGHAGGRAQRTRAGRKVFLYLFRGGQGDAVKIAVAALGRSGHMRERTRERFAFFVCVRAKVDRG